MNNQRIGHRSINRITGRVYPTGGHAQIIAGSIAAERAQNEKLQNISERKKCPTADYGPLLKIIKELLLKYNKFSKALSAWYAIILDYANKMGYNEEKARNMIERDLSLPREIKNMAEENGLTQVEVIELLKNEFDFVSRLIKHNFEVKDELLKVYIERVKKDMRIEQENGIEVE